MAKTTIEDLNRIRERVKNTIRLRQGLSRCRVVVHMGTCGIAAGARGIMIALMEEFEARKLQDVVLTTSSCAGLCSREPMLTIEVKDQPPVKYVDLTATKAKEIVENHVVGGQIVSGYALSVGNERTF